MGIARIRMIDFFNAEDSQAFEEEYVKVAGSLLPLATNLIMTRTSDESLLHIAIYNTIVKCSSLKARKTLIVLSLMACWQHAMLVAPAIGSLS